MNRVNEIICQSEKSQGHRLSQKGQSQALVMINLYVKFIVYSTYAKQVIELKVADRPADEQTDAPDDENRHPSFCRHRCIFRTAQKINRICILTQRSTK